MLHASRTRGRALATAVAAFSAAVVPLAGAQQHTPPSVTVEHRYDSGLVRNTGKAREVIIAFPVQVSGARWLRLEFDRIDLANEFQGDRRSVLRITSLHDGAVQELTAAHCREWRNTSAYFNGDTVLVEVVAPPSIEANRVVLSSAIAGLASGQLPSICGALDDRIQSTDARVGRVLPFGCTAFMIDDCNHCMLTAGHCTGWMDVVEFNVPNSAPDGTIVHPAPSHQYAVDLTSIQASDANTIGDDWGYFGVFSNTETGLTPFASQGGVSFTAAPPPAFDSELQLRVTGCGVDETPPFLNQVQQTSLGTWSGLDQTAITHTVDTTTGNSGSPILWAAQGLAIGIHTHGGCTALGSENGGTTWSHPALQAALADPRGVCGLPCSIAFWKFDDFLDLGLDSDNGHQGVLGPGATLVPAPCGNALRYGPDNNVDEFTIPDYDDLDLTGAMTGMAMIRPLGDHSTGNAQCTEGTIFSKGGNYTFKISRENRQLLFQNEDGGPLAVANINACVGNWIHVAFVRQPDGRTVRFFVNGAVVGTPTTLPTPGTANGDPVMVGNRGPGNDPGACEFNGDIDEIRIFDRALTNSQVKQMYQAGCDVPAWAPHCHIYPGSGRFMAFPQ